MSEKPWLWMVIVNREVQSSFISCMVAIIMHGGIQGWL